MKTYKNIYFDQKNNRYAILTDKQHRVSFVYWLELQKHNIRYLEPHASLECEFGVRPKESIHRSELLTKARLLEKSGKTPVEVPQNERKIEQSELKQALIKKTDEPLILIDYEIGDIELNDIEIHREILLIDCLFTNNFRLIGCEIKHSLWLCNSQFQKHFSLKACVVHGNVHLEGADFSGGGGVSFRALKASNLYLDQGVAGSEDMIWLNEMNIDGVLSIGGNFTSEIQLLYQQNANETLSHSPYIGAIYIGKEFYANEHANNTVIDNTLRIDGLKMSNEINIDNVSADNIVIKNIEAKSVLVNGATSNKDFIIEGCSLVGETSIAATSCSIGGHFKVDSNEVSGDLEFQETSVGNITYFDDNELNEKSKLNIHRFTTSRFLMHPPETLFGAKDSVLKSIFKPRAFNALGSASSQVLADQYCSLKHWLGDSGRLELEDVAFFYMQENNAGFFKRLILGGVFGWGVRLSNILISSLVLMFAFSFIYWFVEPEKTYLLQLTLSIQSFIGSFFGDWPGYAPNELMSNIVTVESFLGVIFITALVGAYLRKLLR